ncbi:MAG: hypothetical protein JSR46_06365 [Verrucomicrobia bacterium]|nr:hypothetical protein [Verrucomicrobiota bacterium]
MNPLQWLHDTIGAACANTHYDVLEKKCESITTKIQEYETCDKKNEELLAKEKEQFKKLKEKINTLKNHAESIEENKKTVRKVVSDNKPELTDLVERFEHAAHVALELHKAEKNVVKLRSLIAKLDTHMKSRDLVRSFLAEVSDGT